jgi:hypothetical protein
LKVKRALGFFRATALGSYWADRLL